MERVYAIDDINGFYIVVISVGENAPCEYHLNNTEDGVLLELGIV